MTPLQLGLHPIQLVYVAVLLFSIAILGLMNYWIQTRAATSRIETALLHHNAAILWAAVAILGLLVDDRAVGLWLVYVRTALSYATTILFVRFATIYSGRSTSLRRPFNALYLAGMAVGLAALVTDPWLGLHFEPLVYHTEPFPYYETGFGPLWQFALLWAYLGMAAALYYLIQLAATSQHRSSRPLVVYSVGMVLALVPSMVTAAQDIPTLPGYDHSVFGLGIASVAFFTGAWLGMVKIAPISRDRLLSAADDGLVVLDGDGQVADYNAVAERFVTDDAVGQTLRSVAPALAEALPPGVPVGRDERATRTTESRTVEFTAEDGRHYSVVVSPVVDMGAVQGYALLLRDATERRETRTELRRQNDQLDDFASSVSHYLRNPLQVASGQTELARQALADRPAYRDRLEDVEQSLDRMETIITDLRTLAKQGKSVESTERLQFGEAVTEAWSHVGGEATVEVTRDGTIQADHGRLLSILENLIRNSVEHGSTCSDSQARQNSVEHGSTSPDSQGRRDSVGHGSAGADSQAPQHSATDEADGGVHIEVRLTDDGFVLDDDGPGIDADHDRLFEYGYTTSSDGTGLGLSIVETMAQSHGWSVRVDTDHDGARFVVTGAVTDPED